MVLSYTAGCKIIFPANPAPGGFKIPHKYWNSLIEQSNTQSAILISNPIFFCV